MEHLAEKTQAALALAIEKGALKLRDKLLSPTAAMPSSEELKAELGGDFFEQRGDAVVINDPDDCPAR